ncbi:MAG: DNA methylase, partial [Lachnospiraceae bacterium]|nr:DNA methylase [Lachnospiraceae bacterium]
MSSSKTYICIDLKSFFASVECVLRGFDPLSTRLVVADASRTDKTICLAVTPALKAFGVPGRPRLFEVKKIVGDYERINNTKIDYIVAPPQMAKYVEFSVNIFKIYLRYVAPEDIHVYSIDEVFIDATDYIKLYEMTAHELAMRMIKDVLKETGITATSGIGTNLYLAKIAMDIVAKHTEADEDGVRIAELNEKSFREILWTHTPITDFWRMGKGTAKKLAKWGIYTMGDLARASLHSEEQLYEQFGVDAEIMIDHAWGYEPCTMDKIKSYKATSHSISSGQVLHEPYDYEKAKLIVKEMTDLLVLDLVSKSLACDSVTLNVGYDRENVDKGGY